MSRRVRATDLTTPSDRQSKHVHAEFAKHERWLRTVLAARQVEPAALDEVMQEVAAAAVRNAGQLRDRAKLAPWLYRIALRQALLHRRSRGRRRRLNEAYARSGLCDEEAIDADPLAWLLAEEQQQLIRRAVAELSPGDAEMLMLKYTEDWTYEEIARRLGVSASAVEARLHRARRRMRSAMQRLAPELATP